MNRIATAALVSLAFLLGSAVGPVGSNAEGRPVVQQHIRCAEVNVTQTYVEPNVITATTIRCRTGHGPRFTTTFMVEKLREQPGTPGEGLPPSAP